LSDIETRETLDIPRVSERDIIVMQEKHILDRILPLFLRYGTRSLTMDDIARELGVSKKTLYSNFRDKNNLISIAIDSELSQNQEFLEEIRSSKTRAIEEFILLNSRIHMIRSRYSPGFYYDLKRFSPDAYTRWISEKRRIIYRMITDNIRKGKKEGVYRGELPEHTTGRLFMAKMEMLEDNDIFEVHETLSPDFMRELILYDLHGICSQKGLQEVENWTGYLEKQLADNL
jgi:AcrR family transcriptional regulator